MSELNDPTRRDLYRSMARIRRFEETVLENFPRGIFAGTTHTYIGQEADAAGVLAHLRPGDLVFSNHRGHGHFLAYGGDPQALFAELMGKTSGVCGGRGGSQHLHWRGFYSNGIQGGIVPVATGMALAEKMQGSRAVTVAFLGDGTLGEGVVYEALNMASLWGAPILYVVEDNGIAQTTPTRLARAGTPAGRFAAFDIHAVTLDTSDVGEIYAAAGPILERVRDEGRPQALVIGTCRFGPHSKGDDTRAAEEIAALRAERDPLEIAAQSLAPGEREALEAAVQVEIQQAFAAALAAE